MSNLEKEHKTYPYLLRGLRVSRPNQVWAADITYLPMWRDFLYLVAIMDWHTCKVLVWRISNTLEADFCVQALNEAIARFGSPEIMHTDQGNQFTSFAEPHRVCRGLICLSYAAMSALSRAASKFASASAGGMFPMGSSRRRLRCSPEVGH